MSNDKGRRMSEAERLANCLSYPEWSYKEIRRLSAELRAERADKQEQCRIIGMSAEREAKLLAELAECKAAYESQFRELHALKAAR